MKTIDPYIQKRFEDSDDRAIEFLSKIYEDLNDNNDNKISNYHLCMLDLLSVQLQLYFTACDQFKKLTDITTTDSYSRTAKSPILGVINKCHANIIDIMQKLSLSNIEIAKLKRIQSGDDDTSAESLYKSLVE